MPNDLGCGRSAKTCEARLLASSDMYLVCIDFYLHK